MATCPSCGKDNREGAAFCGQCGVRLAEQAGTGSGTGSGTVRADAALVVDSAASAVEAGLAPEHGTSRRTHPAVLVAALVGIVGIGGATGYKIATQRGRDVPPYDEKLRAQKRPSAELVDELPDAGPAEDAALAAADAQVEPDAQLEPDAAPRRTARTKRRVRRPVAKKKPAARKKPAAKKPAAKKPGRPTNTEIRACINHRRGPLRRCVEQSALRMEVPPGGTGRATLQPDGTLTNVRVPGGSYFRSCVQRELRTLRCRSFAGPPIEVSYPLRW